MLIEGDKLKLKQCIFERSQCIMTCLTEVVHQIIGNPSHLKMFLHQILSFSWKWRGLWKTIFSCKYWLPLLFVFCIWVVIHLFMDLKCSLTHILWAWCLFHCFSFYQLHCSSFVAQQVCTQPWVAAPPHT